MYERVDKPLVSVIGRMERRGIRVDREYLARLSREFATEIAALEERIYEVGVRSVHHRLAAAARRSAVRPPRPEGRAQGQERPIFDRRDRARAACRRRHRLRPAGARLAPADQAQIDLHRCAAGADQSRDGAGPHQLLAHGSTDWPAVVERPESAEHPDPNRDRPEDPRCLHRRSGAPDSQRRLQPDRAQAGRAHGRRAAAERGVSSRRGHPRDHRRGTVRQPSTATRATRRRPSISRSSTAFPRGGWRGGSAFPRTKAKRSSTAISSDFPGSAPTSTLRSASRASMDSPGPCSAGRRISSRISARPTRRSAAVPSARRSMRRSRAPAPTSSSARWRAWTGRWPTPGSRA